MAIWNYLLWICVTLLLTSSSSRSYKYQRLLNPHQTEVPDNDHGEYYSQTYEYHQWETTSKNRTKMRSENSTLKIINVIPFIHQNQRVYDAKEKPSAQVRDGIVFPEPAARHPHSPHAQFVPHVTEECKQGGTLCLAVPDYPEEYIDNLLSNTAEQWHPSVDELVKEDIKFNQRIGVDSEEIELCSSKENVVFPKAGENKENKWLQIVNTSRYVQGFRIEVCREEKSQCNPVATFRLGMVASCKQKYVLREMGAINSSGQFILDHFRLPSCCTCVVRYEDNKF